MHLAELMKSEIDSSGNVSLVARRFFLGSPVMAFRDRPEVQIDILQKVTKQFGISYGEIHIAGSARIGYSAHKKREFKPKESDLDVAIICPRVFSELLSEAGRVSKGFTDRSVFGLHDGKSDLVLFSEYLLKGMIRNDLMPSCKLRAEIDSFFGRLQKDYVGLFKRISAAFYLSEDLFSVKQRSYVKAIQAEYEGV